MTAFGPAQMPMRLIEERVAGIAAELEWHVCPKCGLAGWAPEGFSYCRLHGKQDPDQALPSSPPTAIEIALGRRIFEDPPCLSDWIKRFGGYAKITAEGWAEYDAAMAERREAKPALQPLSRPRKVSGAGTPGDDAGN